MSRVRVDQSWPAGDCRIRVIVEGEGDLPGLWDDISPLWLAVELFASQRPGGATEGTGG